MRFRMIYYVVLTLLWLTAGLILFYVGGTYDDWRGNNYRYASYLAFLMVAWNLVRVLQSWQKSKKTP